MSRKPICQQFQDDINEVIDRYKGEGLSFAEAVGVLEIVKLDLWISQNDETADFKLPLEN